MIRWSSKGCATRSASKMRTFAARGGGKMGRGILKVGMSNEGSWSLLFVLLILSARLEHLKPLTSTNGPLGLLFSRKPLHSCSEPSDKSRGLVAARYSSNRLKTACSR